MDTRRSEHPRDGEADITALRAEIDALDSTLADLLAARFRVAEAVGRLKGRDGVLPTDPAREAAIVRRATEAARASGVPVEGVRTVFWAVLGYCREGVQRASATEIDS